MVKLDHVGDVAPALLATLNSGEKVYVPVDTVRYHDPQVRVDRVKITFPNPTPVMGMQQLYLYFESLEGPGSATVAIGRIGEIRVVSLPPGQSLLLHHAGVLAMESTVRLTEAVLATYQMPRRTVPSYFKALVLQGPGAVAYQARGNILSFALKPGDVVRTPPFAVVGVDPTVRVGMNVYGGPPSFPANHYFALAHLTGPGNILLHSGIPFYEG